MEARFSVVMSGQEAAVPGRYLHNGSLVEPRTFVGQSGTVVGRKDWEGAEEPC